jgi:hypothetical protein
LEDKLSASLGEQPFGLFLIYAAAFPERATTMPLTWVS